MDEHIITEFWESIENYGTLSPYYLLGTQGLNDIKRFLFSTMDEVRLRYAASCTKTALKSLDLEDADHFRQGLLRREISRDIAYAGQRDHSALTIRFT